MNLPPEGVEYFALTITTAPAVAPDQWQLSVDDGLTWTQAEVDPDDNTRSRWTLAGPEATTPPAGSIVVPESTTALIRYIGNPERIYRRAPRIHIDTP